MKASVRFAVCGLCVAAGLSIGCANARAANAIATGDWSAPGTWSPAEPTAADPATIAGSFTVSVTGAGEVASVLDVGNVAAQTGNLDVDAPGALTLSTLMRVGVGANTTGVVDMTGGTVLVNGAFDSPIGNGELIVGDAGGNGTVNQSGGTITMADEVFIGLGAGSVGVVNVSGGSLSTAPGGRSIIVGFFGGNGALNVSGTGDVDARFDLLIGLGAGSTGNVTMSGGTLDAGFVFTNAFTGAPGSTSVLTQTGGTLNARLAVVLGQGAGTTTYNHSGGIVNALTNNGDFVVSDSFDPGNPNTSTYNISGTAQVNLLHNFIVAAFADATGIVNQTGGTIVAGDNVFVGRDAIGTWNISGGSVTATQFDIVLANIFDGSNGTMNQSGGTVTAGRNLVVGRDGTGAYNLSGGTANAVNEFLGDFDTSSGTMKVSGGTLNLTGNMNVGAALASNADPDGSRSGTQGQAADANGTFIVSGSAGDINIGGDFLANPADKTRPPADANSATLVFEMFDSSGTSLIDVASAADLDGSLIDIDLMGGYTPVLNQSFVLLTALAGIGGDTGTGTTKINGSTGEAFALAAEDLDNWTLSVLSNGGLSESLVATYVPEPASAMLVGIAIVTWSACGRRRRTVK